MSVDLPEETGDVKSPSQRLRSALNALSNSEQYKLKNFDRLVALTENIFRRENVGWVQQMQDMLDELHDEQSENEDINYTT